jgi:hypothetical protein
MYIIINVMFNLVYSLDGTLESRRAGRRVATPDTWEVALSSGADKRTAWERLLSERKLGALALLRNLRNLREAGVSDELVLGALRSMKTERALPFRFIAAARYAPQWEETLEQAMFGSVAAQEKLKGKTVLLVDVSGSMIAPLGDAAHGCGLRACDPAARDLRRRGGVQLLDYDKRIPSRRGFALRDAIDASQPHNGTYLGKALEAIREDYDRIIVITDEQAHDRVPNPRGLGMSSMWPATRMAWATASGRISTAGASRSSSTSARWSAQPRTDNQSRPGEPSRHARPPAGFIRTHFRHISSYETGICEPV